MEKVKDVSITDIVKVAVESLPSHSYKVNYNYKIITFDKLYLHIFYFNIRHTTFVCTSKIFRQSLFKDYHNNIVSNETHE